MPSSQINTSPYIIKDIEFYKKNFNFVKDELLLSNLAYSMQNIVFVLQIYEDNSIPGPLKYSLGKEIIVNTTSIIEAICQYWIRYKIENQGYDINKFFKSRYKFIEPKFITKNQDN